MTPGNLACKIFPMLLIDKVVLRAWNTAFSFCHTSLARFSVNMIYVSVNVIYGEHLLSFWESEISVRVPHQPPAKKSLSLEQDSLVRNTVYVLLCLIAGGGSLFCETPSRIP